MEPKEAKAQIERQRHDWFYQQRAYPGGGVPAGAKLRTWQVLHEKAASAEERAALAATGPWLNIGPAPQTIGSGLSYSNRIEHLAIDPSNANHWVISAPEGGLWETSDAGVSWVSRTDDIPSLTTGAVRFSVSSPQIVYAGIGEPGVGGVLKSTDGGTTWQLLGTSVFSVAGNNFTEIRVDRTNPSILFAATASFFFNSSTGIWKSVDGGTNWVQLLTGRAMDLEVDPANLNRQYTVLGGGYADPEDGVYRYDGLSWTRLSGPWGVLSGNLANMAIAPSNPDVLYVSINGLGLYKTSNAWAATPTWTQIAGVPEYLGSLTVDPSDPGILWGGGVYLYRYNGASWTELTRADQANGIHVDQRYLDWADSRLVVGNDGGVFSTLDGAAHWLDHNSNLSITQFYAGSLHPSRATVGMGGCQDDGTPRWGGSATWGTLTWGDGMASLYSTNNPDTSWATSYQGLSILRTRNSGGSYQQVDTGIDTSSRPFFGKFDKCPGNEDVVIAGGHALWKSSDFFSGAAPSWALNGPEMNDPITAVAFAPSSGNCQIYAYGNNNSQLRLTSIGGGSSIGAWTDLDSGNVIPSRVVTDLAFHPADPNTLYVTLSGYDENTPGHPGHLFKTTNALSVSPTWTNVSAPGSNVPHNTVVLDPFDANVVYVGTDLGVWRSPDGGGSWAHMGPATGMPDVIVHDLQINRKTNTMVAFTYGRGAFLLGGGSGAVPDGGGVGGIPLTVSNVGNMLTLSWGASCLPGDTDYEVYEGTLGGYYSHAPRLCTTGGATSVTFPAPATNAYYLVVPTSTLREGSYGKTSTGVERPQGTPACLPQVVTAACP